MADQTPAGSLAAHATVAEAMTAQVIAVRPEDDLSRACARVLDEKIGAVPVLDPDGRPVGILSKSDLLLAAVRHQTAKAREVMSSPVTTIGEDSPLSLAAATMAHHGVHRLVVVDSEGTSVGILSSMDVLRWLAGQAGLLIAD